MAKHSRVNLREFQHNLAEQLQKASSHVQEQAFLGVRSGQEHWLIPLHETGEVLPLPSFTTVPMTLPWFIGVTNIRGSLYSIVDFSLFCGQGKTRWQVENKLILFNPRLELPSGLLVDQIVGLKRLNTMVSKPLAGAELNRWVKSVWQEEPTQREWHEISLIELSQDPAFLQIEQPIMTNT